MQFYLKSQLVSYGSRQRANNEAVLEKEEQGAGTCNTEEQQLILKLADKV